MSPSGTKGVQRSSENGNRKENDENGYDVAYQICKPIQQVYLRN